MSDEQLFCVLSQAALSGVSAPRTLCLEGSIQGHKVNILVDSGSSHSFISEVLAQQLKGVSPLHSALTVQVANGDKVTCSKQMLQAKWYVDAYSFNSDLKVLPLSSYDMIIGMDWLEQCSPMKVHWKNKWLVLPYSGSSIVLHGVHSEAPVGTVVQVCAVEISVSEEGVQVSMPPAVQ